MFFRPQEVRVLRKVIIMASLAGNVPLCASSNHAVLRKPCSYRCASWCCENEERFWAIVYWKLSFHLTRVLVAGSFRPFQIIRFLFSDDNAGFRITRASAYIYGVYTLHWLIDWLIAFKCKEGCDTDTKHNLKQKLSFAKLRYSKTHQQNTRENNDLDQVDLDH